MPAARGCYLVQFDILAAEKQGLYFQDSNSRDDPQELQPYPVSLVNV